jgi:Condensation domain
MTIHYPSSSQDGTPQGGRVEPLSFGQERLWFQSQIDPSSAAFNIPFATRFTGHLNVATLERSLREIRRRHEALRTVFPARDGRPVQVIFEDNDWPLPAIDVSAGLYSAETLLNEEARRPFDLARGPLLRALLLRLGQYDQILAFTFHHIVFDGWSLAIFTRELATIYAAFVAGELSPLAEPQAQYADFARWQRERLQGEFLERGLAWWTQQLGPELPMLELPTDRNRMGRMTDSGGRETIKLPIALVGSLREFSRTHNVTLFMTLAATFDALLMRRPHRRPRS